MKIFLIFFTIFPFISYADDSIISNLKIKSKINTITYYFDLHNNNAYTDYLLKLEITKPFYQELKIHKTVIEKNIVKIININQLALPAKTKIKFSPNGIFIIGKSFPDMLENEITLNLTYKIQGTKTYKLQIIDSRDRCTR